MLVCPRCGSNDTYVKETRSALYGTRRRRKCESCAQTFTSIEIVATTPRGASEKLVTLPRLEVEKMITRWRHFLDSDSVEIQSEKPEF